MPKRLLRLLAAMILALAVPIQGMAAVMAGQCMSLGHHEDAATHAHADAGADDHPSADHDHEDADAKSSHCGPCTSCCASASIAGSASLTLPRALASADYLFAPFPLPGVAPGNLDRPPLSL